MATLAPFIPGLPTPQHSRVSRDVLQEKTWQRLEARSRPSKGFRMPHDTPWQLTRYAFGTAKPDDVDASDGDFLIFWYYQVYHAREHAGLWGYAGLSPMRFLETFAQVPVLVLSQEGANWVRGDGLLMVVWADDWVHGVRARLHFWVAPPARTLRLMLPMGRAVIQRCFDDFSLRLLEGRTPANNAGALRFIARLGFRQVHRLEHGEWQWQADGTKQIIPVIQSQLLVEHWRAHV